MVDSAPKVRRSPRMSLNSLAQYATATASQRESILRDQKYPPEFKQMWYKEATNTIVRFLLSEDWDEEILVRSIDRFMAAGGSDHEQKRLRYNAEALQGFLGGCADITLDSLSIERGPKKATLSIEGVEISVRPELVLSGSYRGKRVGGGLKLYLSRSDRLTDESAAVVSTLVHRYSEVSSSRTRTVSKRHCQVMDVFSGDVYAAPNAVVRRMRDLEASCREIALRWQSITPPRRRRP